VKLTTHMNLAPRLRMNGVIQDDQKVSVHMMITVKKTSKNIFKSFNHLP
jgi:hypothetical protein